LKLQSRQRSGSDHVFGWPPPVTLTGTARSPGELVLALAVKIIGGGARGLAARPGGGQRVGQAGEEDVEAALELGGAVVGGQGGGKAAQQGEFADRQPVQAQPQQVVGLVWVLDEFLQLVQDVAVQESEQGPVDVQGVGSAEPGACEQGQDVLERAQGAGGRSPSGVASGRVTSSGTTFGWASASAR